jgi:hypothetical protein
MRRKNSSAAADARLLADARADYRRFVRAGLIVTSKEARRDFLAGYVAMENFYKARTALLGHVA